MLSNIDLMKCFTKLRFISNAQITNHAFITYYECYMCICIKKRRVLGSQIIGMSGVY